MGFSGAQGRPDEKEAYRRRIDLHPQELEKLVRKLNRQTQFVLTGQEYKRKKGKSLRLLEPWYNRKSLSLTRAAAGRAAVLPGAGAGHYHRL